MEFKTFVKRVPAGPVTPVSAYKKIIKSFGRQNSFLLESIFDEKSTTLTKRFSRFSIIFCNSLLSVSVKGKNAEISGPLSSEVSAFLAQKFSKGGSNSFLLGERQDQLHFLEAVSSFFKVKTGDERISFGCVGYVSYDCVRFFEKLPNTSKPDLGLPDISFVFHKNSILFDNSKNTFEFVSHASSEQEATAELKKLASAVLTGKEEPLSNAGEVGKIESNTTREEYCRMVEKAKEHIRVGDIFQVVPSQRFKVKTTRDPLFTYFSLREINPSPYLFYLDFGKFQLAGASPEVHVRLDNGKIEMRPIAGTRKRGKTPAEEEAISKELLSDEKERAEHAMLIDLARNDVGRVAILGTVKVPDLYVIEKYSHVQHIVSHVTGEIAPGKSPYDLFRATFPAGTVSGAPKIRAMEIIEELEKDRRGPYAGAVGYLNHKGNMDFCINIRSITFSGGNAYVSAGGGVVLDSKPEFEYDETRRKANACLKAITGKEVLEE
ncbi:Anthranilate synthase component 1 [Candidatus Gugararchaeum adminiculabundum]|nr:Anthranilate synthase component 1 [Candidatus Gugararchaeum adminiculabundum]